MKCSNCDNDALYEVDPVVANTAYYCDRHIPDLLKLAALEGKYPVGGVVVEDAVEEAPKKKKKSEPVVEPEPEIVVEEVTVEEPETVEEPVVEETPAE